MREALRVLTREGGLHRVAPANGSLSSASAPSANMRVNIIGRTRNIPLSPSRALQPLFEAIANSIYAIQDTKRQDGQIQISIQREGQSQASFTNTSDVRPIVNFIVEDNGIGFDEVNFESFNESDSTHRPGAKGIGRFTWLLAFDKVEIESVYDEGGTRHRRAFDFVLGQDGVERIQKSEAKEDAPRTTVRLLKFKPKYQTKCEKRVDTIADKIIENFLYYFTRPNCPKIILSDGQDNRNLNELYHSNVKGKNQPSIKFQIRDQEFEILHLQLYLSREKKHTIHYCANGRAVKNMDAVARIPNLAAKKVTDLTGDIFKYAAYVSGAYLDQKVRDERTDFNIPQSADDLDLGDDELSWEEIQEHAALEAREFLRPFLTPIGETKMANIKRFVEKEAPQYRPVLRYRPEAVDRLKPDLSDPEMDAQLNRILFDIERELKQETRDVLSKTPADIKDLDKYKENFARLVGVVNDVSKSKLAQHVIHRKLILDLLEGFLKIRDDGEYERERVIHQTIYPMKKTSDEVLYEQQNLWIIDERLSYHKFLASDKALSTYKVLKTVDGRKPDITIFVEGRAPYDSVVIIEFKRPMREGYTDEDPIRKLFAIAQSIRDGEAEAIDDEGRPIKAHAATRIYCYFICDVVADQIQEHARMNQLIQSPDGEGYFGYHPIYHVSMEVIDYNKLVNDAIKRNRILFERLDLQ